MLEKEGDFLLYFQSESFSEKKRAQSSIKTPREKLEGNTPKETLSLDSSNEIFFSEGTRAEKGI